MKPKTIKARVLHEADMKDPAYRAAYESLAAETARAMARCRRKRKTCT